MDQKLIDKRDQALNFLASLDSVLVAFSGGVDSSLLLALAVQALAPERVTAVTARSVLNPPLEIETAAKIAGSIGARHLIIDYDPLALSVIRMNSRDRCYHCKKSLMRLLLDQAGELGLSAVIEGSQAEDALAHRPGSKALAEAGVLSPLKEAGFTKADVRELARRMQLTNWDRPAAACLATRFPYDFELNPENLSLVFQAEKILIDYGLGGGRARLHGGLLRLELPREKMDVLGREDLRDSLNQALIRIGFDFVAVDLAGYRSGVFDQ